MPWIHQSHEFTNSHHNVIYTNGQSGIQTLVFLYKATKNGELLEAHHHFQNSGDNYPADLLKSHYTFNMIYTKHVGSPLTCFQLLDVLVVAFQKTTSSNRHDDPRNTGWLRFLPFWGTSWAFSSCKIPTWHGMHWTIFSNSCSNARQYGENVNSPKEVYFLFRGKKYIAARQGWLSRES